MTRRASAVLGVAVLIGLEGIAAARIGFASFAFQSAVLMLASGWVIAGSGLVAWSLAPASRIGWLLVAAGATSYLGAFDHVRWDLAAEIATRLTWLHVALLAHAVLTHPDGRARTPVTGVLVGGVYVLALLTPRDDVVPLALGFIAAIVLRRLIVGRDARRGLAGLAGIIAATGLAAGSALALAAPGIPLNGSALRFAGLAAAAVLLAGDAVRSSPARARVTDAVLRLDPSAPTSVVAELRRATGDPTLVVGFRTSDGTFVDQAGHRITMPGPGSDRIATGIGPGMEAGAVVIHDARLGTMGAISSAGARAIELASANARLQAELRAQVADVRDSRRRIVEAGDAARGALEGQLASRLLPSLAGLEACLEGVGDMDGVTRSVADVRVELRRLADGLHPGALEGRGLAGALDRLAERCPVPVAVSTGPLPALPTTVAATAWYVCSEALTNVAKHARATSAALTATVTDGRLDLEITDDGVGGADPYVGSGLRGLRDRVEALGGTLRLESAPGSGTRLRAELPVTLP